VDNLSPEQRRECMRAVRGVNTSPEIVVRSLVHSMGFRYALHVKRLAGKPDIVLVSRGKIIFVHGCFWHKHTCRHGSKSPTTNSAYWNQKRDRNFQRDRDHIRSLRKAGWQVQVIWECWTHDIGSLREKLARFLDS
jgi:DNA mismatch endonuclease (patch repair protein)